MHNNEVLNELREIAPALAKLPRSNAFSVPPLYFINLPKTVVQTALNEEEKLIEPQLSQVLQQLKSSHAMQVPEGYFTKSRASVLSRVKIEEVAEEVASLSPQLATHKKSNPFTVPANYFASLPQKVIVTAKAETAATPTENNFWTAVNSFFDRLLEPLFSPGLSFALASILMVVTVGWLAVQQQNQVANPQAELAASLERVNSEDVHAYIAINLDEFDEYSISKRAGTIESTLILNENLLNDESLEKELLKELDEEFIYDNLDSV